MSSSEEIVRQFSGVIPGLATGQNAVAKTYVDDQFNQRDGKIATISSAAANAQSTADRGVSAANTAQNTADRAVGLANNAQISADKAQQNLVDFINMPEVGVQDQSITTRKIKDSNITQEKLADNAVTSTKLSTGAVTNEKITKSAVTQFSYDKGETDRRIGSAIAGGIPEPVITEIKENIASDVVRIDSQLEQTGQRVNSSMRYVENEVTPRFQNKISPMVTFVSDDIDIMDYNANVKSSFIDNNIPCVLAAIPGRIESSDPNTMTYDQLREMQDVYGYEISSHTYSHLHLTDLTDEEIDFECRESKRLLELNGLKVSTLCIPYGFYDNRVKQIAQKYYRGVRRSGNQVNPYPISNLNIISYSTEFEDLEACKAKVDEAITKNRWLVFLFHAWSFKNSPIQLQNMKDLIAYIKTKTIDVVTLEEGMNRQAPVVDVGANSEFRISQEGFVYSKQFGTYYQDTNAVTANTPIGDYVKNALNICPITTNRTTFPDGQSGLLLTYNFKSDEPGFQWQEYHLFNQSKSFRRRANHVGTWLVWNQIATSIEQHVTIIKGKNEYTGDTLPNQLPVGKVINSTVSTNTPGMPKTYSGLLITNTTGLSSSGASDYGFITQEYIRYGTNEKWFRTAASETSWNPWVPVTTTAV